MSSLAMTYSTHYELMHEDCELCYSCDYCKPIRQMAAPYTVVDWTFNQ